MLLFSLRAGMQAVRHWPAGVATNTRIKVSHAWEKISLGGHAYCLCNVDVTSEAHSQFHSPLICRAC